MFSTAAARRSMPSPVISVLPPGFRKHQRERVVVAQCRIPLRNIERDGNSVAIQTAHPQPGLQQVIPRVASQIKQFVSEHHVWYQGFVRQREGVLYEPRFRDIDQHAACR